MREYSAVLFVLLLFSLKTCALGFDNGKILFDLVCNDQAKDKPAILTLLKNPNTNVNYTNDNNESSFYCSYKYGDDEIIRNFLKRDELNINVVPQKKKNPKDNHIIFKTILENNYDLFTKVIRHKNIDLNVKFDFGNYCGHDWKPLWFAIDKGRNQMVKDMYYTGQINLMEVGVTTCGFDWDNGHALMFAAKKKNSILVKWISQKLHDTAIYDDSVRSGDGWTMLSLLAFHSFSSNTIKEVNDLLNFNINDTFEYVYPFPVAAVFFSDDSNIDFFLEQEDINKLQVRFKLEDSLSNPIGARGTIVKIVNFSAEYIRSEGLAKLINEGCNRNYSNDQKLKNIALVNFLLDKTKPEDLIANPGSDDLSFLGMISNRLDSKSLHCLKAAIEHPNIDVNAHTNDSNTNILNAMLRRKNLPVVELLLKSKKLVIDVTAPMCCADSFKKRLNSLSGSSGLNIYRLLQARDDFDFKDVCYSGYNYRDKNIHNFFTSIKGFEIDISCFSPRIFGDANDDELPIFSPYVKDINALFKNKYGEHSALGMICDKQRYIGKGRVEFLLSNFDVNPNISIDGIRHRSPLAKLGRKARRHNASFRALKALLNYSQTDSCFSYPKSNGTFVNAFEDVNPTEGSDVYNLFKEKMIQQECWQ
ncbi:MAG: hypothetical protein VX341_02940 [Bdellovibrionota bacterium]|nr:hypothetical protein [Bdellovibrionota bacterium]